MGDFNIYIFFDTSGFAYKRLVDILETFDFVQHIDKPTHNSGHLLDYILTRKDSSGVSNLYVSDFICDHRALHVSLTCNSVYPQVKQIDVRSLKRIQCDVLEAVHFDMYSESCMAVKKAISQSKSGILQKKISDCKGDQKNFSK